MDEHDKIVPNFFSAGARKTVSAAVFLVFLSVVLFAGWLSLYSRKPGPNGVSEVVVYIPKGVSFDRICEILEEGKLIHPDIRFKLLARLHRLSGKLRAGEFVLQTGKLPLELLGDLVNAKPLQHKITIAEGLRATEIAAAYAEQDWCSEGEFLQLVNDHDFIGSLGMSDIASLEGYLFPDTYFLTRIPVISAKEIVTMMVKRFQEIYRELGAASQQMHEVVILASIVEKESADPEEMPRIASVFLNRLAKGMRLQSDPTVIYGLEHFTGNLTKTDLMTTTLYNTYTNSGLPPGPISNPGRQALGAALHPSGEKYLYFVSKNDGTHYFSTNLKEHNRAVSMYQKRIGKKKTNL